MGRFRFPTSPGSRGASGVFRRGGLALLLAGLALTLSGCSVDEWKRGGLPLGITEESARTQNLWRGAWIAALVVGVVVWGLILWACALYRRRRDEHGLPPQVRYNIPIEALYTVLPFVIITVLFVFTARDESALMKLTPGPAQNEINVVGKQWSWDFNYVTAGVYETGTPGQPPTLVLPRGEKVRFILNSRDVIHDFWVPAFLFKEDVIPGRTNVFEVTPQKLGTYAGKCAEYCGQDHSAMLFSVRVVEPAEYDQYVADLRTRGQTGALPEDLGPDGLGVKGEKAESEASQSTAP